MGGRPLVMRELWPNNFGNNDIDGAKELSIIHEF